EVPWQLSLPPGAWIAELRAGSGKEKVHLGLSFDLSDDTTCIVKSVAGGLAAVWNKSAHESQAILPFDRIIRVNGMPGSSRELVSILLADHDVFSIALMRPEERIVDLSEGTGLGICVKYKRNSVGFWVNFVQEGAVQRWNEAHPEAALMPHDRVISVNGQSGTGADLLLLLRGQQTLRLQVMHYED
ncbi:unnamed protein product, partial [Effrenium voratum]